ncbi:MAG: hypothetical protein U0359_06230 [Byssovorax sp.]
MRVIHLSSPAILAIALTFTAGCKLGSNNDPAPEPTSIGGGGIGKQLGGNQANLPGASNPDPGSMGLDGLPAVIPSPGSAPPSVAEWNSVPREITVKGSSALGCETKMLREWLRVSCHKKGTLTPTDIKTESSGGQQAYVGMFGTTSSVVVQVIRGRQYSANLSWDDKGVKSTARLLVDWPSDHPRPAITLH